MAKIRPPANLPQLHISPMILVCPLCGAKPGHVCETASGGTLEIVHVARIKAAAAKDAVMKKERAR
jgi:hypothetical protein